MHTYRFPLAEVGPISRNVLRKQLDDAGLPIVRVAMDETDLLVRMRLLLDPQEVDSMEAVVSEHSPEPARELVGIISLGSAEVVTPNFSDISVAYFDPSEFTRGPTEVAAVFLATALSPAEFRFSGGLDEKSIKLPAGSQSVEVKISVPGWGGDRRVAIQGRVQTGQPASIEGATLRVYRLRYDGRPIV